MENLFTVQTIQTTDAGVALPVFLHLCEMLQKKQIISL